VLTPASVHDSQVVIPLMTMTSARLSYLYDLMDAAYDAAAIHDNSKELGHAPIIDRNFRAQHEVKAEWAKEVERMKFIHMPDPTKCSLIFALWPNGSTPTGSAPEFGTTSYIAARDSQLGLRPAVQK
jgi:hypothetical protein